MSKKVYCVAQFQPKEGKLNELFEVLKVTRAKHNA